MRGEREKEWENDKLNNSSVVSQRNYLRFYSNSYTVSNNFEASTNSFSKSKHQPIVSGQNCICSTFHPISRICCISFLQSPELLLPSSFILFQFWFCQLKEKMENWGRERGKFQNISNKVSETTNSFQERVLDFLDESHSSLPTLLFLHFSFFLFFDSIFVTQNQPYHHITYCVLTNLFIQLVLFNSMCGFNFPMNSGRESFEYCFLLNWNLTIQIWLSSVNQYGNLITWLFCNSKCLEKK